MDKIKSTIRWRGIKSFRLKNTTESENELDFSKKDKNLEKFSHFLQPDAKISLISLLFLLGLSFLIVKVTNDSLPTPLTIADTKYPYEFIEERARNDLLELTSPGVRVTGSEEADILATSILTRKIEEIQENYRNDLHLIEFDIQRPSGSFWKERGAKGQMSTYSKIPNVLVKISPKNQNSTDSILLNCHFDSAHSSPGATDDMISCSVMLEILRSLSISAKDFKNSVVFLFNGAEEYGMHGTHGFIKGGDSIEIPGSGHIWSQNVTLFLNLEGAGGGGKEILFQTGPKKSSQLVNAYKKGVKLPFGTVLGEEAFQMGLIPSFTDFWMLSEMGGFSGLDLSFVKNGYVYHTKWDRVSEIPPGSIQNMGNNVLGIVEELIYADISDNDGSEGKMVFFDVLGIFFIAYSETVGHVLNILIGLVSLIVLVTFEVKGDGSNGLLGLVKSKIFETFLLIGTTLIAWGFGIAIGVFTAKIFDWSGYPSPFQSIPTLPILIFGLPALLSQALVFSIILKKSYSRAWLGPKLLFSILSISLTFVTRITFLFSGVLLFHLVGWFLTKLIEKYSTFKGFSKFMIIPYLIIGEFFPLLFLIYILILLLDIFVPTVARDGTETNPNEYISLITSAIFSILTLSGIIPLISSFKKRYIVVSLIFSIFVLNFTIVFGFIGKIPYGEKTPMKVNLIDSDIVWYENGNIRNETRGYVIWPEDPNTEDFLDELSKTVTQISDSKKINLDYENCEYLYCSLPHMSPVSNSVKKAYWIQTELETPSNLRENVKFTYSEEISGENIRKFRFRFEGPTQMTIVLSPGDNYSLLNFTLGQDQPPEKGVKWTKGRDTYFIFYQRSSTIEPFEFTCNFLPKIPSNSSGIIVDIKFDAFYLHGPKMSSEKLTKFSNRFPMWVDVASYSAYTSYYTIYS